MPSKTRPYREVLLQSLTNPDVAAAYLSEAINDSPEMFRKALRNVAQSRQMSKVAKDAGVTRESLYRATSGIGNPTLETLDSVLEVLDLKLAVVSKTAEPSTHLGSGLQTQSVSPDVENGSKSAPANALYFTRINNTAAGLYPVELKPTIYRIDEEQEQGVTFEYLIARDLPNAGTGEQIFLPGFLSQQQGVRTEESNVES
jgi:probable addiction module antidote protein